MKKMKDQIILWNNFFQILNQKTIGIPLSLAGIVFALGIAFGDIGTSPLYVVKAILSWATPDKIKTLGDPHMRIYVLGAFSAIFWTLTLQASIKYVLLILNADREGQGGIFALFGVAKNHSIFLKLAAIVGGACLLADGFITPPISTASAMEGLEPMSNWFTPTRVLIITIAIITILFLSQKWIVTIAKVFGFWMVVWFLMLLVSGVYSLNMYNGMWIFNGLNPYYAYSFIVSNPQGLEVLGGIFLCVTGGEALYSDLGHCGQSNIRWAFFFVKFCLIINYAGQLVYVNTNGIIEGKGNPFFDMIPHDFRLLAVIIATGAAIIASQALISGSFSLISEAIELGLWPKMLKEEIGHHKGQLFIGKINTLLFVGCVLVLLLFKRSANMEAAYGLAIVLTMLMTTLLFGAWLFTIKAPKVFIVLCMFVYISIEMLFLYACIGKFSHGGFVTAIMASLFFIFMMLFDVSKRNKAKNNKLFELGDILTARDAAAKKRFVLTGETLQVEAANLVILDSVEGTQVPNWIATAMFQSELARSLHKNIFSVHFTYTEKKEEKMSPFGKKLDYENKLTSAYHVSIPLGWGDEMNLADKMTEFCHKNQIETTAQTFDADGDWLLVLVVWEYSYNTKLSLFKNFLNWFYVKSNKIFGVSNYAKLYGTNGWKVMPIHLILDGAELQWCLENKFKI